MTETKYPLGLSPAARTVKPFIERTAGSIAVRLASIEEVQRFAQKLPPAVRWLANIGVTAGGGYLMLSRERFPRGSFGDALWHLANDAIDMAASSFAEKFNEAGEGVSTAEKGQENMASKLALTRGKERKLHMENCPKLPAEREAGQGNKGPIPAIKHDWYSLDDARTFKMITPDGIVAAENACDSCKDAIAASTQKPAVAPTATTVAPAAPAGNPFMAAIAAWIMPGQKPPKAAELLAANPDLAEQLDLLINGLLVEERASAHETIVRYLDSEAELKVLTSTQDPNVFRNRLLYIKDKSIGDKLGVPEIEKGLDEISTEVGGMFDDLKKIFGNQKGNP